MQIIVEDPSLDGFEIVKTLKNEGKVREECPSPTHWTFTVIDTSDATMNRLMDLPIEFDLVFP